MTEEEIEALATALAPHLNGVTVTVARIKKNTLGGKVLAYVDLTFASGGAELFTVDGFKLMERGDGQRWLATPQTSRSRTNPETSEVTTEYRESFHWAGKNLQERARSAASEAYKAESDIPFDGAPPSTETAQ